MTLPDNVLAALRENKKIKAIKLLREQRGIGLKEAKDIVDRHLARGDVVIMDANAPVSPEDIPGKLKSLLPGVLVIMTFVWVMINLVEVAGSVIVLWHRDNYREEMFIIAKVHYDDDDEAGLTWGFIGRLTDSDALKRMYAPKLADAKALGHQRLREMYPAGMKIKVWYNPDVTDTLFQHRTLHIIPYTPDLVDSELAVIYHWLVYCFLPFAGALVFARAVRA